MPKHADALSVQRAKQRRRQRRRRRRKRRRRRRRKGSDEDDDETTTKERTTPPPPREPTARTPSQHGSGGLTKLARHDLVCTRRPVQRPTGGGREGKRTRADERDERRRDDNERVREPPSPRPPNPGRPPATSGSQPREDALGRGGARDHSTMPRILRHR